MNGLARSPFAHAVGVGLLLSSLAAGQPEVNDLRLTGVYPTGLRPNVTESWGALQFQVVNPGPDPKDARVAVYYPNDKSVQYARDVTVPGHAKVESWLPIGPAIVQNANDVRELELLLMDRTGGQERVILPPSDERVRSRGVIYRKRSESTGLIVDKPAADGTLTPATEKALLAAAVFRASRHLSPSVYATQLTLLPPMAEGYDGVDQIILAGSQLLDDPAGRNGLRQWVGRGGYLWVMLDQVDPRLVAALLGDGADIQVVDRVGLTSVQLVRARDGGEVAGGRDFDHPVELVRVELSDRDRLLHTVNGWPASFVRPFGHGRILFTTLGSEAWHRPREASSRSSRESVPTFNDQPLPIGQLAFDELSEEMKKPQAGAKFSTDALRPMLTEEIGYEIVGRNTAALFLGGFLAALLVVLVALRSSRWRDLLAWGGPVAALLGAGVFVYVGERGRRAVPPTEGAVEIVDSVRGTGEISAEGLFAIYTPGSGAVPLSSVGGGIFDLDSEGLEGQSRRRVQTDLDAWTWDRLSLPAGIRIGSYRRSTIAGELSATARFGPDGIEGQVVADSFRDLADGTIAVAGRPAIAVRFGRHGSFHAGRSDVLAEGDYLAGSVLSDSQQRRQRVYRQLLALPATPLADGYPVLFAWAEPESFPFAALPGARPVRSSLLTIPLEFERPSPGTPVYIASSLVAVSRTLGGKPVQPTRTSNSPIEMRLRFQVPSSAVPMVVERATVTARLKAPGWTVRVGGDADGVFKPLLTEESPVEPVRVAITDPALLKTDDTGGVYVHLNIEFPAAGGRPDMKWQIDSLSMDLEGRTPGR